MRRKQIHADGRVLVRFIICFDMGNLRVINSTSDGFTTLSSGLSPHLTPSSAWVPAENQGARII